ncbi:MAG: SDR family NAD(P)-dependent oxidoreductase [Rubripirellula sp.]
MSHSDRPVALVTGAATGVGKATALQFAKLGYDVVVNFSRSETEAEQTAAECEATGAKALLACCDVSNDENVRGMLTKVEQTFGRLDVLVNNAATTSFIPHSDFEGLTEAMWDRMLGVNLKGAFFVSRAAAKLLRQGDGGAVVNVSSVAAETGSGSSIAYCASKAGLNTMTKSLARVLAPEVRVNAVCPGPIDSRWIRQGNPDWDLNEMVKDYPLPRPSRPEDIADAIVFFATGTSMATGQILSIDGGQTL